VVFSSIFPWPSPPGQAGQAANRWAAVLQNHWKVRRQINMKIGIILETNEPEKAWNGVRFGNAALKQGHEVKIFLMSAGVEIESITHEKYNAKRQLEEFTKNNGVVLACGTCLKSRN
jgi:hypothetical protein